MSCRTISHDINTNISGGLWWQGPLARYVNLRGVHMPRMLGTFFPPSWASHPDMHHGTCVMHVTWCTPELLASRFLWSRWCNAQFSVSGKRAICTSGSVVRKIVMSYAHYMVTRYWRSLYTGMHACGTCPFYIAMSAYKKSVCRIRITRNGRLKQGLILNPVFNT